VSDQNPISTNLESDSKHENEKLFQMLEVKLGQERIAWQRAKSQIRVFRIISFLFLFLLIVGALVAYFLVFSRPQERRSTPQQPASLSDR
jgi:hypothetical protein